MRNNRRFVGVTVGVVVVAVMMMVRRVVVRVSTVAGGVVEAGCCFEVRGC